MQTISIIVPCYNEEKNVGLFFSKVSEVIKEKDYYFELIFINDGSKDNTKYELDKIVKSDICDIKVINFSRNFGKEAAIFAGLENAKGDLATIIDADLQQDPQLIIKMIDFLEANPDYDSVAFYQKNRHETGLLKLFKKSFYKIMNKLTDVEFVSGASDFRMFRRNMIDNILSLTEKNRFSKGIFSWIGFNTFYMPYEAKERASGTSKWSFWKLFKYAVTGIISFSNAPLKMATIFGSIFSFISFLYVIIIVIQKLMFGIDIPGYATIVILILMLGGIQLLVLGVMGEYIATTYSEVKKRPIYIAKSIVTNKKEKIYDNRFI